MDQLIPRTLRRWEDYQSNQSKLAIFSQFQSMTKGRLIVRVKGDSQRYSFGYGNQVQAEIFIENDRFFSRFWNLGELGFGESFQDGDWNSPNPAAVIRWFFLNGHDVKALGQPGNIDSPFFHLMRGFRFLNERVRSVRPPVSSNNWATRYDLDHRFYALMLDPGLHNSGALFGKEDDLKTAQERKLRRMASELKIVPGAHVLELGSGWGSFALFLAQEYQCRVTAVTLSEDQHNFLAARIKARGLENQVTSLYADYRSVTGRYDRIASIELIDTIPTPLLPDFFALCNQWLKPGGRMVHQLLLTPESLASNSTGPNVWNQKHINPGTSAPSLSQVLAAMREPLTFSFELSGLKGMGLSYSKTLRHWSQNFQNHRKDAEALGYDEMFLRSWHYYLAYAEAAFGYGLMTAAQLTMSRGMRRHETFSPKATDLS